LLSISHMLNAQMLGSQYLRSTILDVLGFQYLLSIDVHTLCHVILKTLYAPFGDPSALFEGPLCANCFHHSGYLLVFGCIGVWGVQIKNRGGVRGAHHLNFFVHHYCHFVPVWHMPGAAII
jgi:hypothetical protein